MAAHSMFVPGTNFGLDHDENLIDPTTPQEMGHGK